VPRPVPAGRPVVALDFDGVLNALAREPGVDRTVHWLEIPAEEWRKHRLLRQPGEGVDPVRVPVSLRPADGPWIQKLQQRADVCWATSWEDLANRYVAPLLGIEPLPLGTGTPSRISHLSDTVQWKADSLADRYFGRPICWADDIAWPGRGRHTIPSGYVVVRPNPELGLVDEDRRRIGRFVSFWSRREGGE
jgi:hypothetical protein